MESFYPKFGEVELVLVEDENDFFDPLESNFECEDENEDVKLQLNDTIHEENNFNLEIDDSEDEIDIIEGSPLQNDRSSDCNRKSRIKQEISEQYCDNNVTASAAHTNANRYGPIITPKCELGAGLSDDSLDTSDVHFYDNDSNEDSIPFEAKPNIEELNLSANKTNTKPTKSMAPENRSKTITDANELSAEKKVNSKKLVNIDDTTPKKNAKTKRKSKIKATATATATATTATAANVADDATHAFADDDEPTSSNDNSINNENKCKKKPSKDRKSVKTKADDKKSTRHYSRRNEIPKNAVHNEAYDKKLLFCKICSIQFDRSPAFTEHMRAEHSIDKPFECFICLKAYRISSLLAEHIRYHFNEKPYGCEFCGRRFSQLQPYKAHIRKAHTLERPYQCNFIDENNVKCEETFFDTKTYKFHMREHTGEQPFSCEYCSKKFNHSGTYQAHMRIHTNEKPFTCEFCSKKFNQWGSHRAHLRIHTNERPYTCHLCGKSFAQISTHKAHMLTHSDEYRFPCTICEKKFKQATNLKLHMRVHTKECPYKCEDCGRGFAQLVTYRNHRRIHTGEKPFACKYEDCGKSFRHRNSFRRHLQTHTGEKPFECNICFKRLSQTSSYVAHMRRHERLAKS